MLAKGHAVDYDDGSENGSIGTNLGDILRKYPGSVITLNVRA